MSSIDERIVELQFNNGQFEQGVATSLGTLERLKKGLNLEASAKSLNGLNAAGKSFSLANVASNIQTVSNRFSALGIIGDQVLRRLTDTSIRLGKKILTAVPNQIIEGGKRRAQNIEQAKFQLEGLGVAWSDVSDSIDAAVTQTAYGMDEAAKVASQYVATGVKLGEEMTRALTAISGVAAMTNSTYEDTGRIFTTVAGQGRLMGDQLNQLAARGLNVAAALTKYGKFAGKTEEDIRKMVSKGQISFKDFSDAMYEAFGSHAKEAEKTFNGALSNVKASLSRMGAKFATPAFEETRKVLIALKQVFKTIEKLIDPLADAFVVAAEKASTHAIEFLGAVDTFLNSFLDANGKVKKIESPMKNLLGDFFEAQKLARKLAKTGPTAGKNLEQSLDAVSGIAQRSKLSYKEVGDIFQKVAKQGHLTNKELGELERSGVKATKALSESLGKTESQIHVMAAKGMISFQSFSDAMTKAFGVSATGTITIEEQAKRVQNLANIVHNSLKDTKLYGQITQGMGKALDFLGLNLDLNASLKEGVTDSEELVTVANKVIDGLYGNGEERKKLLTEEYGGWALIQNKVNELLGCEKRHEVTQEELNRFAKEGTKEAEKQNEKLKLSQTILKGLFSTLQGLISAFNIIKSAGAAIWNNIIAPFVQWAVPRIVAGILSITGALGEKLAGLEIKLLQSDFFNTKAKAIADFFVKTKDAAVEFGKKIKALPGFQKLTESLSKLWESIKGLGTKGATWIRNFFKNLTGKEFNIDGLLPIIDGLSTKLSAFIDSLSTKITNLPTTLGGLFDGLSQQFPEVQTFFQGIIDSIYNTILDWSQGKISLSDIFGDFAFDFDFGGMVDSAIAKIDALKAKIIEFIEWLRGGGQSESAAKQETPMVAGIENTMDKLDEQSANFDQIVTSFQESFANFDFETLFKGVKVGSLAYMVLQIGGFFRKLKGVAKEVGKVPTSISGVFDALADTIGTYQKSIKANILLKIAGAIAILAGSLWVIAQIPQDRLMESAQVLTALCTGLIALYGVFSLIHDKWPGGGGNSKEAGLLDPIAKSLNGFLNAAKHALNALVLAELGAGLLLIAQGMLAIVAAFKLIAKMDLRPIIKNFGNFIALFVLIGVLAGIARIAGRNAIGFGAAMVLISISLGIMALVIKKIMDFGLISRDGQKALEMMEDFLVTLGVVVGLGARIGGKNVGKFGAAMILVAAAIAILTGVIIKLSKIPPGDLKNATMALDSMLIIFAVLGVCLSKASSLKVGTGIMIGLLIAEVVGALIYLTTVPVEDLKKAVISLDSLLAVLALTLLSLSKIENPGGVLAGVLGIMAVMGTIMLVLYALKDMEISTEMINSVVQLRSLIAVLALSLRILQHADFFSGAGSALAMVAYITILGGFIVALTAICSKVNKSHPGFQKFLEEGIPLLNAIGSAIGGFLGNIAGGFIGGITTGGLPVIAKNLADFATNLGDFCDNIGKFDKTALDGALNASKAIIALADAQGEERHLGSFGPFNLITGKEEEGGLKGLVAMLPDLLAVADGIAQFGEAIGNAETDKILDAADAIKTIADSSANVGDYSDGRLTTFAEELESFATPFKTFAETVSGEEFSGCTPAIQALADMVDVAKDIPDTGLSLMTAIFGDNDLKTFGTQMADFALSLVNFNNTVAGKDFSDVKTAAKAVKAMVSVANAIPNSGLSALSLLVGDNDLVTFGRMMESFADSLVTFNGKIDGQDFSGVKDAAKAVKAMVKVANTIENSGGAIAKITGDNKLDDYGEQLAKFGGYLRLYSFAVKNIDVDSIANSATAVESLKTVLTGLDLGNAGGIFELFRDSDLTKMATFSEAMGHLGTGLKMLTDADIEKVGGAITQLNTDIHDLAGTFTSGGSVEGLTLALQTLATDGITAFKNQFDGDIPTLTGVMENYVSAAANAVTSKSAALTVAGVALIAAMHTGLKAGYSAIKEAGSTAGGLFALGIYFKKSDARSAGSSLASAAKSGAGSVSLYSTGQNIVQGLINGMKSKLQAVKALAWSIGKAAAVKPAEGAQVNSPSKITTKTGKYIGEGLIVGMQSMSGKIASAGSKLGETTAKSLNNPLAIVSDILGADFDVDPTITPVLDLSNIQNGARSIGGILSGYSVNAGLINASMNGRVQVSNADVVSAINDLSNRVENLPKGDTYTVGGITYDDGTNIATAVRQLAAAARVQRRA